MTNFVLAYHEGLLYPLVQNYIFSYDIDMITHFLQLIAGFLFFRSFVNLPYYYKKYDTLLKYYLLGTMIVYLGYFLNFNHIWIEIADVFGILFFVIVWGSSFFLIKKEPSAKLITIGFGVVVVAGFFHITFAGIDNIPVFVDSTNIVKFGAVLEAVILAYATTHRTKVLKEQNEVISNSLREYINQIVVLENSIKELSEKEKEKKENEIHEKMMIIANQHQLTERETEVLIYLIKGLNNKQIADKVFLSVNTIKYHIRKIYEKLEVNKRTELQSKIIHLS